PRWRIGMSCCAGWCAPRCWRCPTSSLAASWIQRAANEFTALPTDQIVNRKSKMSVPFAIIAVVTLASAIAAMSLRNLVHCALSLVVTFAGLAVFYLQLGAQFVGLAQILVYVGAVAILIVF